MNEQLAFLPVLLSAHVRLTLAALAVGILLGVPFGVLAARVRALKKPVLATSALIQTIPALALLAVMVPLLSVLRLPAIGTLPAFLGLALYSLFPIVRSTVAGLHGLDPGMLEAARAMGMTRRQRLRQVELPLSLPVIVAGVRTAAAWTVGMATLSTPVGAPSLGNYIFGGLQTRNASAILLGCAASAALALVLDVLLRLAESGLRPRRHWLVALAGLGLLTLGTWAWLPLALRAARPTPRAVRVGAKSLGEQYVLAEIVAEAVRSRTGRRAETSPSLGSAVAFEALRRDEIDLYVEYTGVLWSTVMGRKGPGESRRQVLDETRAWLRDDTGVTLVATLGFENAYRFAVRRDTATLLRLSRLDDLTPHAPRLSLASDFEFFLRADWRALRSAYGLTFHEQRTMDPSLLFQALAARQVDVITANSSDGRIPLLDLVTLEDDRHVMPPYDAVVLAGPRLARERPDVVVAVGTLEGSIDIATMRRLNRLVDVEKATPAAVAREFLAGSATPQPTPRPPTPASPRPHAPQRRSQPAH